MFWLLFFVLFVILTCTRIEVSMGLIIESLLLLWKLEMRLRIILGAEFKL